MRGSLYTRRFLQSAVLSSKKGRKYEASRRSEPSKSFYRNSTLSDGASDNSSVSAQAGALFDEIGSEGCVPVSGYTPTESKVSSIFVAEESIPVPSSAIRPQYRTIGVHSLDETSCKFPKETGYTPSPVFRRYAHHRIDPSGDPSVHPDGNGSPRVVGVRDKQGEVDTNPLSVNYIPGVYDRFDENALHAPSRESAEITDAMSSDSLGLGSTASNLSPVIGTARVLPPSGLESTSSFSSLTSPPNQGSGRIESQLHNTGPINASSQRGTDLVAPELSQSQWQPDYSSHARPHNFHRRLLNRLGGCVWQKSDQREMVSHRETVTYKCSRTERCYAGNTVPYEESTFEDNIPEHGQLNCSCLYQSQGRYPLPRTAERHTSTLELVHSERPVHNSTPCSRENQCDCRSRVKRISGQQRLDDRPNHYPTF